MGNTPVLTPKELCRLLEKRGFELKRIKGSHHYYQDLETGKITVVPMHKKDLPKGTFHAILKQAGIDKNDL
ncbi:MAG: type II toxin-antitoxin system HicA family toxin [Cyclobacteriaceae bacterium]